MAEFNIKNFIVLAEELSSDAILDFFEQEGIKSADSLKDSLFVNDSECDDCDCKETYKSSYDYRYKYNEDTNRLVKCNDEDEDAIYDFVFYVCKNCNRISYYIEY